MKLQAKIITYFILSLVLALNTALPAFTSFDNFFKANSEEEIATLEKLYGKQGKILICTSYGFKYVTIEELQNGDSNGSPHNDESHCPLCIITAANNKTAPSSQATIDVPFNPEYKALSFYSKEAIIHSYENSFYKSSRAPPKLS